MREPEVIAAGRAPIAVKTNLRHASGAVAARAGNLEDDAGPVAESRARCAGRAAAELEDAWTALAQREAWRARPRGR